MLQDKADTRSLGEILSPISLADSGEIFTMNKDMADIINKMDALRDKATDPNVKRWASTAITHLETGLLFAHRAINGK